MSIRATSWVLHESTASGNDRMVLFVIADEADDDGTSAFPSMNRIAKHANIDRGTAMRSVARLEAAGELLVRRPETRGRGRFNRYVLLMGRDPDETAKALGWKRSQIATIPQPVDNAADEAEKGSERLHEGPFPVAPDATRPVVRPIDTGATQSVGGKPRRRGLDPVEPSPMDLAAIAQRQRHAEQAEREAGRACPHCQGYGWRELADGSITSCAHTELATA